MSGDDDYEYYAPVVNVVEENELTEVEISAVTQSDLINIEKAATGALTQKLEKLSVIIKNADVYCADNALLVNDKYGVCRDLSEIAQAFGLEIKQIECGLRGKTYVLQDALTELIRTINENFNIEKFANRKITPEVSEAIKKHARQYAVNAELSEIFRTIKSTGRYAVTGTRRVTETYEDGLMVDRKVGAVVSDAAKVTAFLKDYMARTDSALKNANENLRDGTVKLLHSRARQMGYAVKEERKGEQVQLVLVRCE